jgi:hypothetical protein
MLKFAPATFQVVSDQSVSSSRFLCAFASLPEFLSRPSLRENFVSAPWQEGLGR